MSTFSYHLCTCSDLPTEKDYFVHIGTHLRKDFKAGVVITTGVSQESSDNPEEEALNQDDSAVETDHACSSSDVDVTKNLPKVIEQNFVAALLKLEHFAHVPGTKIDDFLEELHYLLSSATLQLHIKHS